MQKLTIIVNDEEVFEYSRELFLDDQQLAFLDRMDDDMERGLKINGERIDNPDSQQRARFVAFNLIKALKQKNDATINLSSAYLVNRLPDLIEVRVNDHENGLQLALVEESNQKG